MFDGGFPRSELQLTLKLAEELGPLLRRDVGLGHRHAQPPLDPRARGCNDLLRHGATLTETAEDVLSQLGAQLHGVAPLPVVPTVPSSAAPSWSPAAWSPPAVVGPADNNVGFELILERLGPTPVAVDELVRQCQMSAAAVATLLLELELVGRVERHPGNLVSLR